MSHLFYLILLWASTTAFAVNLECFKKEIRVTDDHFKLWTRISPALAVNSPSELVFNTGEKCRYYSPSHAVTWEIGKVFVPNRYSTGGQTLLPMNTKMKVGALHGKIALYQRSMAELEVLKTQITEKTKLIYATRDDIQELLTELP